MLRSVGFRLQVVVCFGVRRPVGALVAGDLSPAVSRQVATDESGDRSPHSKTKEESSLLMYHCPLT